MIKKLLEMRFVLRRLKSQEWRASVEKVVIEKFFGKG